MNVNFLGLQLFDGPLHVLRLPRANLRSGVRMEGGGGRIDSRQVNTRTVLQVPHHDGRALASKSLGDAEADSGRGCCDQTDFAGQTRTG